MKMKMGQVCLLYILCMLRSYILKSLSPLPYFKASCAKTLVNPFVQCMESAPGASLLMNITVFIPESYVECLTFLHMHLKFLFSLILILNKLHLALLF